MPWHRYFLIGIFTLAGFAGSLHAAGPAVIDLWPEGVPGLRTDIPPEHLDHGRIVSVNKPTLTYYPAAGNASGAAVIICPGGGYLRLAINSESPAAVRWLNSLGIAAFVLKYRLQEYGHPAPLRDVLRSVRLLRAHAADYGINPSRIGVLGASSGGHLAACAGTLFDDPEGKTGAALDSVSARPDFLILLYPVITLRPEYYKGNSRQALLGKNPSPGMIDHLSTELHVTKATPPAFLAHAQDDTSCPVENSIMFYRALRDAGVPAEMHLYEKGQHGFGLRPDLGPVSDWPNQCEKWMRFHGWLPPAKQVALAK
jgi:acetyl esterase/lipase